MKISIIICTYNGEKYLEQTINSALNQTYDNFEIIIVDDNSIDNSQKIIENFSNKFLNIKYSYNNKNFGLAFSRNKAIEISNGEWITFLDQDDKFNSDKLSKMLLLTKKFKENKFFFHDTFYIDDKNNIIRSHMENYNLPYPIINKNISTTLLLKYGSYIDSESVFFNRCLFEKIGKFNLKYTYLCDYEFFLRISMKYDLIYTKEKLANWRIHENQQQKINNNQKKERLILFTEFLFKKNTSLTAKFFCLRTLVINFLSIIKDKFNDK